MSRARRKTAHEKQRNFLLINLLAQHKTSIFFLYSDILIPQLRIGGNESLHHIDASFIVQDDNFNAA